MTLGNINAPQSYTITGEGKGGIAGFCQGGAPMCSSPRTAPRPCFPMWSHAQVGGGKIAQLGSRLIDSSSKKLAGQFFARFNEVVSEKAAGGVIAQ